MLYRDNVHTNKTGYQAPGNRSLILVHTNVHKVVIGNPRTYQIIKLI